MHPSTFEYLKPTNDQVQDMSIARQAAKDYCDTVCSVIPDGPGRDDVIHQIRTVAMWVNVHITREEDGRPRS